MTDVTERLANEMYTTAQVAKAVGRTPQHWCRIRPQYIVKHKLEYVKLGRAFFYKKGPVDRMVERLLKEGDG